MESLKFTEILEANKLLSSTIIGQPYKVTILSNVIINSFKNILEYFLRLNKIEPEVNLGNYDNIIQDTISVSDTDMVIIMYDILNVVDGVEGYFQEIDDILYEKLKEKIFLELTIIFKNLINVPVVIFNTFSSTFFVPSYFESCKVEILVSELNEYLSLNKPANVYLINFDKVVAQSGVKAAFDSRFYQLSKAPYSVGFFKNYCKALQFVLLKNTGKLKKAIIFDCDNTLWHGVIGEDGEAGIDMSMYSKIGKPFNTVQKMAKMLSKRGILVGICSKNNPEDVDKIITTHKDVDLKSEFIVIKRVNWEDKATNLREIANELNISLESIVFVDDSSFEVNLIKEKLPEVLALQVPTAGYPEMLQAIIYSHFNLNPTADDTNRTANYKEQFMRIEAKNKSSSLEEYLASLQMQITIEENNPDFIARVAQLTQKTNQFNLTTKRYTENQIEQFLGDSNIFVNTLAVKDKFGDNGLTGVCIIKNKNDSVAVIDTLLMSCRIIGRNIEIAFLNNILHLLKLKGFKTVLANFISTTKNAQVNNFYEKMSFKVEEELEGQKKYSINLDGLSDHKISYISIN